MNAFAVPRQLWGVLLYFNATMAESLRVAVLLHSVDPKSAHELTEALRRGELRLEEYSKCPQ